MVRISSKETNEVVHRAIVEDSELQRLLADFICNELGNLRSTWPGVTFKVTFEDATTGSPAYKIGTRAIVTITEDRTPRAAPKDQETPGGF